MKTPPNIIYFLGIGGIGMSSLARFYRSQGYEVYGYDLTSTPLTKKLQEEGMHISFDESVEAIPDIIKEDKTIKIIYTPAIPKDHKGFCYFNEQQFTLIKRAKALGEITANFKTIAIAGTHGKTTTSAIAAHIMKQSSIPTVSFVGGVMSGYESNILMDEDPEWIVVEADEFDRSFLQLEPRLLGITSVDADHLDIYNDEAALTDSFRELAAKIKSKDDIIICDAILSDLNTEALKYGFSSTSDLVLKSDGYEDGYHQFSLSGLVDVPVKLEFPMPGNHNALNASLAASICFKAGVDLDTIVKSIRSFKGVKRRFEFIINSDKLVFIDDYAHHPTEIDALISAVRMLYPGRKVSGIFQPHLFSRTRDFADQFAESLSRLDALYLLEIYPAREKSIPGIDSKMLLDKVTINEKSIVNKETLAILITSTNQEILLTIGAGDIAQMVPAVKEAITNSKD
jgi:UDP-N-acetylmuramate--alanine ligase